jgi:hypothetical protein
VGAKVEFDKVKDDKKYPWLQALMCGGTQYCALAVQTALQNTRAISNNFFIVMISYIDALKRQRQK